MDKWGLLKSYVDGMYVSSTGQTQKMIGKIAVQMDILEAKDKEEYEKLLGKKQE